MAIEYSDDRRRWEAETPRQQDRPVLQQIGFRWDRAARVWYAPCDDVALAAMEVAA